MFRQAPELREKIRGPENPDTLMSMNNIALVLKSQCKYEAAEKMRLRTLRKKVLDPEH
jgi:hypothetical protein